MPVVVRVVLPLAAGAMLAPLPANSASASSPFRAAEPVPIRAIFCPAVLREEGWVEGGFGALEAESETRVAVVHRSKTHRLSTLELAQAALAPHAYPPPPDLSWISVRLRSGPDRCACGYHSTPPERGPPTEDQ